MIARLLMAAALVCSVSLQCSAQLKVGDKAPAFSLSTIDGHRVNLEAFSGKVVLLNFWATWCTPCRTEMPRFIAFGKEYGPENFQVIGISMDDSEAPVKSFARKLGINYPIAMGTAGLAESYGGVLGLPITVLIDRSGRIAKRYEGAVDLDAMQRDIRKLIVGTRDKSDHDHR